MVHNERFIKINNVRVINKRYLLYEYSFSDNIKKYFSSSRLYVKYDEDILYPNKDILNIPGISVITFLSWLIGADVYVDILDNNYLESLYKIRKIFKNWLPEISIDCQIHVDELVRNNFSEDHDYGILFPGGIDSLCSYILNKNKKLRLITIIGGDLINKNKKIFMKKFKQNIENFASGENLRSNYIETNINDLINNNLIKIKYRNQLRLSSLWEYSHGLIQISLCAPLSVGRFGNIIIASSQDYTSNLPNGSHHTLDHLIKWGRMNIIHDGSEYSRQEKIRYILKPFMQKENFNPILQVCNNASEINKDLNCCRCEKCYRTIVGLILENIDPNKSGFNIRDGILEIIKKGIQSGKVITNYDNIYYWKNILNNISVNIENNMYLSKDFF